MGFREKKKTFKKAAGTRGTKSRTVIKRGGASDRRGYKEVARKRK